MIFGGSKPALYASAATLSALAMLVVSACHLPSNEPPLHETLRNPSIQIMVAPEELIPTSGTYHWGPHFFKINLDEDFDIAALARRLRSAIAEHMEAKGFRLAASGSEADVLVGYAVAGDAAIDERSLNRAYGDGFEFSFPLPEAGRSRAYHQGVLILDVMDNRSKGLLWRGALVADVDMRGGEQEKVQRANSAVGYLLGFFPHPEAVGRAAGSTP